MEKIKIIRYRSSDGREFESEEECLAAEEEAKRAEKKKKAVLDLVEFAGKTLLDYRWHETGILFSDGNPLYVRKTKARLRDNNLMIATLRKDFDELHRGTCYIQVVGTDQDGEIYSYFRGDTDKYFFSIMDKWKEEIAEIASTQKEEVKEQLREKIAKLEKEKSKIEREIDQLKNALGK